MKRFLFFIVFISNFVFAQQKPQKVVSISINYRDYSVKFHVLNVKKNIPTNENLTYYWYAYNKLLQTKGGYEGKILTGPYTCFYLSENLKEKGSFSYGLKNGKWISWYENGQINEISNWKNGLLHGKYKYFDSKGYLLTEADYKKGTLNGYKITYSDQRVVETKKYKNGKEILPEEKQRSILKKWRKEKTKSVEEKKEEKDKTIVETPATVLTQQPKKEKKKWRFFSKNKKTDREVRPLRTKDIKDSNKTTTKRSKSQNTTKKSADGK